MDNQQLRAHILSFSLDGGPRGNQGYTRVLLQLFGYNGHGKSSFINSCKYVIHEEEFIEHAEAGERQDHGAVTTIRKAYKLTENITLVDNRGYSKENNFQRAEIYAQLGNFIPIGEEVEWKKNYSEVMDKLEDADLDPNYSDFIVPILVHSVEHILPEEEKEEMKELIENCYKMTGIVPIVVITKRERGIVKNMKEMFRSLGAKEIIAIENFTRQDHSPAQGKTEDILKILTKALECVTSSLNEERGPRAQRVQRRKFLLNYIYQADLEQEKHKWRQEEEKKEEERKEEERRREESRWWWKLLTFWKRKYNTPANA